MAKKRDGEAPSIQVAVRFPVALVARIEHYRKALNDERPALALTRADVIRVLVHEQLDALDRAERQPTTKRTKPTKPKAK